STAAMRKPMARQKRRSKIDMAAVLTIGTLLLATGYGDFFVPENSSSGGSNSGSGDYVYVANQTTGTLAAYSVGSGTLAAISGSPYSLGFAPNAVAVNPANTIVFVAGVNSSIGYIDAFSIGSNGSLSLLAQNNAVLADPISLDVSPDGQWLIGLDGNGLTIDEYQINANTGQLTLATGFVYANVPVTPRSLKISPNGNFVFAAIDTAGDLVFPFNTTNGVLSSPGTLTLPSQVADNALAVSPNGGYLYIARSSGPVGSLAVYSVDSGGGLTPTSGSPFAAGSQPFSVVVNSAGTAAYVANQLDSNISGYTISSSGSASAISGSPFSNTSEPSGLVIDKTGKYLLAISNAGKPDLTLYSFDSTTTGKLNFVSSTSTGTDPTGPISIAATH
ncbi:MAG TPA: beta-propeller fold lactonase family protein, partial [Acidobacteriaceae bacterium]|nr:beta-propeller fold lactonase family protein [Acidobacteriaceae bacterium]